MEAQEKSFQDLLREDRLKRLERQLKLKSIKGGAGSSPKPASPHMSLSSLSSIHGDNGALSDFSFGAIPSNSTSRAGSVVVASSINLRTELLKNIRREREIGPAAFSENDRRSSDMDRLVKDSEIMPPPSLNRVASSRKQKLSSARRCRESDETERADNFDDARATGETIQINDSSSKQRASGRVFKNWIVRLNDVGQIIIKGKLESGELARSKPVKKRTNATTVVSVLNHQYRIVGEIYDVREELPEYVRGKFYNGFPTDWENVRQIWHCYVASGSSSKFRWPRPVADSDDDIRSDITDFTVSRPTGNSVSNARIDASPSRQPAKETSTINATKKADLVRKETAMESDISSIRSNHPMGKNFDNGNNKTPTGITDASNSVLKPINGADDRPTNRRAQPSNAAVGCSNCGNLISRRKIDVIVDNMMNKNCSVEYIDKVLAAINCLNELLLISPTTAPTTKTTAIGTATTKTNDVETLPDESVCTNYNSNAQYESMADVAKTKVSKDKAGATEGRKIQAKIPHSNSYSLESSEESQEESPTKRDAFCRQESARLRAKQYDLRSRSSDQPTRSPGGSSGPNWQLSGKLVDENPERGENPKIAGNVSTRAEPAIESRNRVDRHRRESIRRLSISGVGSSAPSETNPANSTIDGSSFVAVTSRRVSELQSCSMVAEITPRVEAAPDVHHCDSDISILMDGRAPSSTKSKTLLEDEIILFTDERDSDNKAKRSNVSQNVYLRTPSKSGKATPTRRRDMSRGCHESVGSDSENVSMRMSSRGRRILPPLDFWNGERVTLRDQELVYTPDASRTASVSSENLQQSIHRSNGSGSALIDATAKTSNKTPKDSANSSKPAINNKKKNLRSGRVLTEIPNNRETISDHAATSDRRNSTRSPGSKSGSGRKVGRPRRAVKYTATSSSEEEANFTEIPKRKKHRRS